MLAAEVVVHTLAPEERLVHHPVAFRAVQLRRRAVGVLVAVRVVQRIIGHLAVKVVGRGFHVRDVDGARSGFLRHFGQHAVSFLQDGRDVAARRVGVAVLIPGLVIGVAHVRVIAHRVVELNHRILGLPDVQFVKTLHVLVESPVVQVLRQPVGAYQLAPRVRGVALRVEAAKPGVVPFFQVAAVAFQFQSGDAHVFQLAFQGEQFLEHRQPVYLRAVLYPDAGQVPLVVKRDGAPFDILHGAQNEGLEVRRQVQTFYCRTLGEGDGAQCRAARRVHFLQTVAAAQVKARQVRVVHHVQFPQHGQLRAQHQFLQHGQVWQAHVRKAAPVAQVELLHPLPAVQVEDGADVRRLPVGVAPLPVLRHRVVGHGLALSAELEVEVTRRGGPHRSPRRAVALERYVSGRVLARAVSCVEQAHTVAHPPVAVRLAVALHGFQVGVFHVGHRAVLVHLHALGLGLHVLIQRVQVVDALAELRALLVIEHGENRAVAHAFPDAPVGRSQLVRELLPQVLPQHAVVSCVGVHSLVLRAQFRIGGVFIHVPRVFQAAVVAHAQDGVAVVEYHVGQCLFLVGIIPKSHHHVLHPLVDAAHDVREHVVVTQIVHIEVVGQLRLELRTVVLRGLHPLHHAHQVLRQFGACLVLSVQVVIVREPRLEHLQPVRGAVIALRGEVVIQEHPHRVVVVQELPALRRVLPAELLRHPCLVVVARYVQESEHGLRALVVVEIEFSQKLRCLVNAATVEQVTWLSVYRCAHVILVAVRTMFLRWREFPCLCQDVLHQLGHTCVV